MGKGVSTSQTNVSKKLPKYRPEPAESASQSTGTGGRASSSGEPTNVCLITFRESISFNQGLAHQLKVGLKFTLVPDSHGGLQIVGSGQTLGSYSGEHMDLLKRCIADNYVYRGTILTVKANDADCEIKGFEAGDDSTSAV